MRDKPILNPYLAVLVGVFAISFSALFVRLSTAPVMIIATYRLLFTFLLLAPYCALLTHVEADHLDHYGSLDDIVDAFEAEGFAWGGRWYHYDTMHFEWRPELFDAACK